MDQHQQMKSRTSTKIKSSSPAPPTIALLPEGFVGEAAAAKLLGLDPATLRSYRYRWTHGTPGEHGPLFFEGTPGSGTAKRVAYRVEDLRAWQAARGKVDWKPATPAARTMKKK
jgi:hypothetical protein